MNVQIYELITQRIIGLLTQGTVPWHKPWTVRTGMPRNLVTQKPYRGINVFLLLALRYESPLWLTYRQALRFGGNVRKCEKSCPVVFWKKTTIEDEAQDEPKEIRLLRLYHVFNAAQCEGLNSVSAPVVTPLSNALKPAEIVNRMPQAPVIKHGMAHAYYSPADDHVGMPTRERFQREEEYFSTLFHELVHKAATRIMRRQWLGALIRQAFRCGYAA